MMRSSAGGPREGCPAARGGPAVGSVFSGVVPRRDPRSAGWSSHGIRAVRGSPAKGSPQRGVVRRWGPPGAE